jgi:hypothetical protein
MLASTRATLESGFAGGVSYEALIGDVDCKPTADCTDRYGAGMTTISEVAEPVKAIKPPAPAPAPKAARKETPPPTPRHKNAPEEDREYMRKLNQDLNNL